MVSENDAWLDGLFSVRMVRRMYEGQSLSQHVEKVSYLLVADRLWKSLVNILGFINEN